MVRPTRRTFGPARAVGPPEEASRNRRKHQEVRQARRADAGRVPGLGHDPTLVAADAAGAGTSHAGPAAVLHAAADHGHQEQAAAGTGRLQRRYPSAVREEGPTL